MFVVSQAHENAGQQSRRDDLCLILWVVAANRGQTRPTIGWNLKDLDQFQFHHLVQAGPSLSVHVFLQYTRTTKSWPQGDSGYYLTITDTFHPAKGLLSVVLMQNHRKQN